MIVAEAFSNVSSRVYSCATASRGRHPVASTGSPYGLSGQRSVGPTTPSPSGSTGQPDGIDLFALLGIGTVVGGID